MNGEVQRSSRRSSTGYNASCGHCAGETTEPPNSAHAYRAQWPAQNFRVSRWVNLWFTTRFLLYPPDPFSPSENDCAVPILSASNYMIQQLFIIATLLSYNPRVLWQVLLLLEQVLLQENVSTHGNWVWSSVSLSVNILCGWLVLSAQYVVSPRGTSWNKFNNSEFICVLNIVCVFCENLLTLKSRLRTSRKNYQVTVWYVNFPFGRDNSLQRTHVQDHTIQSFATTSLILELGYLNQKVWK